MKSKDGQKTTPLTKKIPSIALRYQGEKKGQEPTTQTDAAVCLSGFHFRKNVEGRKMAYQSDLVRDSL